MTAIYKKEVKGYLTSMIGYVFIFFILLLEGIYFTAYNIQGAYPVFGNTLSSITFLFLILIPVLTMKTLADERRQKTDQMLLTSPISVENIVFGKYLALVTVYLIPVIVICFYPLIMSKYGTVSYAMAYTAILGYAFLGFAQLSIGVFISSLTENPVIAAVVGFLVLFVCFMTEGIGSLVSETSVTSLALYMVIVAAAAYLIYYMIKNILIPVIIGLAAEIVLVVLYIVDSTRFEGSFQDFLKIFNITSHFDNFTNGILDLQGLVYFLSIIIIFLFLTIQSIKKRRWS